MSFFSSILSKINVEKIVSQTLASVAKDCKVNERDVVLVLQNKPGTDEVYCGLQVNMNGVPKIVQKWRLHEFLSGSSLSEIENFDFATIKEEDNQPPLLQQNNDTERLPNQDGDVLSDTPQPTKSKK